MPFLNTYLKTTFKIITAIKITHNQLKISPICKTKLSIFFVFSFIFVLATIDEKTKKIEKIKQFLLNYNFNEVFTNSLVSETKRINSSVALKNPLNSDLALLRNSLIPNILEIYPKNLRFGINYLKFFEIGRVYESNNGNIRENEMLACSFAVQAKQFNSKLEFFTAKSFIEQFLLNFNNIDS
jgi:phenylalanyl-tRNA synthetase beta subunit